MAELVEETLLMNMNLSDCYPGQCELLNQSTCLELDKHQSVNVTYDEDGCFSSSQLKDTVGYQYYQQVRLWYLI